MVSLPYILEQILSFVKAFYWYSQAKQFLNINHSFSSEYAKSLIMGHVYYEVNLEINKEIAQEYLDWLIPHSIEMLEIDGFLDVTFNDFIKVKEDNDANIVRKVVVYKVESMEKMQQYFDNQAKKMRGGAVSKFGGKFKDNLKCLIQNQNCKQNKV